MLTWFRRFALIGGIIIVLELVAWVGIATLGPDAFRQLIAFYDPRPEPVEIVEQVTDDGRQQRCALFRGELLCIGDDRPGSTASARRETPTAALASAPPVEVENPTTAPAGRRCASFEGQTICIKEGT